MTLVSWFDEVECENLCDVVGGKCASLCALFQNQFPVVEGFMVCADAFREFMSFNSLWEDVFRALDSIDWVDNSSLAETGEYLRKIIMEAAMPDELVKLIARYYSELGADVPVAVRSSGTAEDLDDASFAGQQETFLFVIGEEDLIRYVKACWASLYNDSAIFYRREKGFDEREIAIAVVVQKMVNSEKSGVLFTANPITNDLSVVMIEATWGLGEGLVQGLVNPDNYLIQKETGIFDFRYVPEKDLMVVRKDESGGVETVDVPEALVSAPVLTDEECRELVELAVLTEEFYQKPQDIEWAYEGNKLYLLQSRPITTL
jgi:pyruvate,water dikinase